MHALCRIEAYKKLMTISSWLAYKRHRDREIKRDKEVYVSVEYSDPYGSISLPSTPLAAAAAVTID